MRRSSVSLRPLVDARADQIRQAEMCLFQEGFHVSRIACALAALGLLAGTAHGQVYKCVGPNGTTIFADAPCASGAKPIDVRPAAGRYVEQSPTESNAAAEPSGSSAAPSLQKRADTAARRRGLQNQIDFQERKIGAKTDEMNAKLDELRYRKRYANNNLAGATWEQSISQEMNAVSASYETELKSMRDELARLRSERDRLPE